MSICVRDAALYGVCEIERGVELLSSLDALCAASSEHETTTTAQHIMALVKAAHDGDRFHVCVSSLFGLK